MGKPFWGPPRDFTKLLNYDGVKTFEDKEYLRFNLFVETSGGPFEYDFWNEPKIHNGETYYVPFTFIFEGAGDYKTYWIDQRFHSFTTDKPDDSVFDIPDQCKIPNLPYCPNFGPEDNKYSRFRQI